MRYGGKEVREGLREVCNRVWKGEGWPEKWGEGVVVPVIKKEMGWKITER